MGAGLAGTLILRGLREAGVDVRLFGDERDDSLDLPLRSAGTVEPTDRLEHALGTARARELVQWSLGERLPARGPGWRLGRAEELQRTAEAAERLGLTARVDDTPMGPALVVDEDGQVQVDLEAGEGELPTELRWELLVVCEGWTAARHEPWFADKLAPVRQQLALVEGHAQVAGSAQAGHLCWAPHPDGVLVRGARWATPHLEVGERERRLQPRVQERLQAWALGHWGPTVLEQRALIQTTSCDNLPIVGPLPGRGRVIACTGFGQDVWALAPAAARAVVEGVLSGRADQPACVSASRLG